MTEMQSIECPRREDNGPLQRGKIFYRVKNIHRDEGGKRDGKRVEGILLMISPSSLSSL
jgi:hypothetical protein